MNIVIAGEIFRIKYIEDPNEITRAIELWKPSYITYDVETTGLHVKKDVPTVGAILLPSSNEVYAFTTTEKMLSQIPIWAGMVDRVYGHNITFDMHMSANIIGDQEILKVDNWGDTMGLCRLIFESISSREGGDSLKLNAVGKKYIDKDSDYYEKELKKWMRQKRDDNWKVLVTMIRGVMQETGWTKSRIVKMVSNEAEPIPQKLIPVIEGWKEDYPMPTYADVPEELLLPYLAVDVILTHFLVKKSFPIVKHKGMTNILETEFKLIPTVFKMVRNGLKIDKTYLLKSKEKVEKYIQKLRSEMHQEAGVEFTVGQHKFIKELFTDRLGYTPESTDAAFLKELASEGDQLAKLISKLRTLEKWLSTYINRILEEIEYDGMLYANLGQFNPVSGRFSGDFQQMPNGNLETLEGEELFHPRKMVVTDGGDFDRLYFLDFSQVELRLAAHYTLPFGGDMNLCRAYMPFKCIHRLTGEVFNHTTEEGRRRWNEELGGESAWMDENGKPWVKTDVHSATTNNALPLMGISAEEISPEEFASWRNIGKAYNFMKLYGGSAWKASSILDISLHEAESINAGFEKSFPLLITYQKAVISQMYKKGYVQNLYGRRYYLHNSRNFYKCANYLIQGSCGDDLKHKMIKIDKFLVAGGYRSQMVMCIHDEIVFKIHKDERHIIPKLKQIMEYTPVVQVPIIAEVEYTSTNWAEVQAG